MSTKDRYQIIICEAIERLWQLWSRDEPLYLTVGQVAKEAQVSRPTAKKYLEILHAQGWIGKKLINNKLTVYPVTL